MFNNLKYLLRYIFIPDKTYIKYKFKKYLGHELNLENPQTFNEKLQWLKLYDRTKIHTQCADKFLVRNFIKEKIGEEYLIPLIFVTENPKDINIASLPDFPVIIKPNHSRGAYIIKDKTTYNFNTLQKKLKKEMKINFYHRTREWQYKNIKPLIIVEKLLMNEKGQIPNDYKFLCMNGKVELIQVDTNRFQKHEKTLYDSNWNKQDFEFNFPKGPDIEKPILLNKMIKISEILSKNFDFIRVDLYTINNQIFFGELTFHPAGGFGWFKPKNIDYELGQKLTLTRQK